MVAIIRIIHSSLFMQLTSEIVMVFLTIENWNQSMGLRDSPKVNAMKGNFHILDISTQPNLHRLQMDQ